MQNQGEGMERQEAEHIKEVLVTGEGRTSTYMV